MRKTIFSIVIITLIPSFAHAGIFNNCFTTKDELLEIAQQIRQESQSIDWEIGKVKSISVAGIIKAQKAVYPDGKMEVCLKESEGRLKYIMKSSSSDAETPEWHLLSSSKEGWF
ncbi:MAG: hypothetical protein Q9N02_05215 [Ghiorsea sp.]|nr:hypothetical protein [Ghiorsea sp.]